MRKLIIERGKVLLSGAIDIMKIILVPPATNPKEGSST